MSLDTNSKAKAGSGWGETAKIIVQALAIAMVVRVFFYQPFNIPSGSMKSTLLIGDYLFVSKLAYGYSRFSFPFSPNLFSGRVFATEPKRGDVAVFRLPQDESVDYIKRVVGLPGDEIQMKDGVLHINGVAVPKVYKDDFTNVECDPYYRHCRRVVYKRYLETLPDGGPTYTVLDLEPEGEFDNTDVFKVPAGKYFMMGDNRDNSSDSRASVGYVPFENFVGRAEIIFFSAAIDEPDAMRWTSPWTWPFDIRWSRIFDLVR
jgi:signal peptidase I